MSIEREMSGIHGCEDNSSSLEDLTIWIADILVEVTERRVVSHQMATDVLVKGKDERIRNEPQYMRRVCEALNLRFKMYQDGKVKILEIYKIRRVGKALQPD